MKIYVYLENCYGISKFKYTFEFNTTNKKAYLIYAPNGVMKTSFANTLNDICLEKESEDCYYPDRNTIRRIKYDDENGIDLSKNDILVIPPYIDNYKSENVSILLADGELKNEYDIIHAGVNEKMQKVFSNLDSLSGRRDSENYIAADFSYESKNIYDCLEYIFDNWDELLEEDYSSIRYSKLISTDTENILSDEEIVSRLSEYIEQYERLLTTSKVFKTAFNHNKAEDVLGTLQKDGFFKAEHKILLADTDCPIGEDEFKDKIVAEKARILNEEMSEQFEKVDAALKSKVGTQKLRDYIFENRSIIPELIDMMRFKKKIWVSYLNKEYSIFKDAILNYKSSKARLCEITRLAQEQRTKWNSVVSLFNDRFSNMPFKIEVINKDDVILKSDVPTVFFKFKDRGIETPVEEKILMQHLSSGERRALYLLNIIFEVEARKELGKTTLLIMDDIADSFDYRNKYAIIEYLKDIVDNSLFTPIILTHNFDFYRTVASRVGIKSTTYFAIKNKTELSLEKGEYFENVFYYWKDKIYTNDEILISSIAYIRNLVEYTQGVSSDLFMNLTSLLHYKKIRIDSILSTDEITLDMLYSWFEDVLKSERQKFTHDKTQKAITLIFDTADRLVSDQANPVHIENKIVLSIAIRQKAERYMVTRINDDSKVIPLKTNQTRELQKLITLDKNLPKDREIEETLERVLIITSENIHINSFMYEPIIDMSLEELKKLYKDVNELSI